MFIPDPAPDFFHPGSRIRIQGSKKHRMPQTWIRNTVLIFTICFFKTFQLYYRSRTNWFNPWPLGRNERWIIHSSAHAHHCTVGHVMYGIRISESKIMNKTHTSATRLIIHSSSVADQDTGFGDFWPLDPDSGWKMNPKKWTLAS